jgi:RimJ/RimL family protein N-acetyltransferase
MIRSNENRNSCGVIISRRTSGYTGRFAPVSLMHWESKMTVTLRPFSSNDLKQHIAWAEAICARRYVSHIFPKRFDGNLIDNNPYFCWYVITYNDTDVGSVWIEKQNSDENAIQLGILIGNENLLGKGIGRKAIEQAILDSLSKMPASTVRLNVRRDNKRAQACYKACGFKIVSQDVKTNDFGERIDFFTMEKEIPNNRMNQTLE